MANWIQMQAGLNRATDTAGQVMNYWQNQERLGLARDGQAHRIQMERDANQRAAAQEARTQEQFDLAKLDRAYQQMATSLNEFQQQADAQGMDFDTYAQQNPHVLGEMARIVAPDEVAQGLKGVSLAAAEFDPETQLVTFQVRHADGSVGDSGLAVPYEELRQRATGRLASYGLQNLERLAAGFESEDPRQVELTTARQQLAEAVTTSGGQAPNSAEDFLASVVEDVGALEIAGQPPTEGQALEEAGQQSPGDPALLAERDALRARIAEQRAQARNPQLPTAGRVIGRDTLGSNLRRLNQIEAQLASGRGRVGTASEQAGQYLRGRVQSYVDDIRREGVIGALPEPMSNIARFGKETLRQGYEHIAEPFVAGLRGDTGRQGAPTKESAPPNAPPGQQRGPMTAADYIDLGLQAQPPGGTRSVQMPDGTRLQNHTSIDAASRSAARPIPGDPKARARRAASFLMSAQQMNGGQPPAGVWALAANIAATGSPRGLELMQQSLEEAKLLHEHQKAAAGKAPTAKEVLDYQKQVYDTYDTHIENAVRTRLRGRENSKTYKEEVEAGKAGAHMARMELSNEFKLVGLGPGDVSVHPEDYAMISDIATRYYLDNHRIDGHNREADKVFTLKTPKARRQFMSYVIKNIQDTPRGNPFLARMALNVAAQAADDPEEQKRIARRQLAQWEAQAGEIDAER